MTAKQALDAAEIAEREDPGSNDARTKAYVAERRAQLAVVNGRVADVEGKKRQAREAYERELEIRHREVISALDQTSGRLVQTQDALSQREQELATRAKELAERESELAKRQEQLAARDQALAERDKAIASQQEELAKERAAREAAEARYRAAVKSLEEVAQIKEDQRGTVLTFSGAVLFGSGKSVLLPVAREQLGRVASALREVDENRRIIVEGHTDSRGSRRSNLRLSRARAESVRDFLIEEGAPRQQISAVGKGEAVPVASNRTAEGRATNRRVEIVISDADK